MSEPKPLTAIIADSDVWIRRSLGTSVVEAGFEVVAEATHVLDVLREASYLSPTLVVLTQDSLGMNPMEILGELRTADNPPEVLLVTHDTSVRERAIASGAFGLAQLGDPDQLLHLVRGVRELIETGERRKADDRRSGRDRRVKQDWLKVTKQRRDGIERRVGPRRKTDDPPDT